MAVLVWSPFPTRPSVPSVPKPPGEDALYRDRIARVLRELRQSSGWTRSEAAEAIDVPEATLGKWERAEHAPKGYDLGRLFRAYQRWGAQIEWFLEPPEVVEVNPIRARLDELEQHGAIAADEREARVRARRQSAVAKRVAGRGTPPTGRGPRSARRPPGR